MEVTERNMIKNQKYIFLYALILTVVVFNIGIFMGYMLEVSRAGRINDLYIISEMKLLDQLTQKGALDVLDLNCGLLVKENIRFGDEIFQEALQIYEYEKANRINDEIILYHKRFDLLRALFWMNSMAIKEKCSSSYHNVVYFYKYNEPSIEQESKQKFFSNLLMELKGRQGDNIMLIPIAADNDISSINLLVEKYEITELPVVLIDEKIKVTEINAIEDIEKYLV